MTAVNSSSEVPLSHCLGESGKPQAILERLASSLVLKFAYKVPTVKKKNKIKQKLDQEQVKLHKKVIRRSVVLCMLYGLILALAATLSFFFIYIAVWPPESQDAQLSGYLEEFSQTFYRLMIDQNELNLPFLLGVSGLYATLVMAVVFSEASSWSVVPEVGAEKTGARKDPLVMENMMRRNASTTLYSALSLVLTVLEVTIVLGCIHIFISRQIDLGRLDYHAIFSVDDALALSLASVAVLLRLAVDDGGFGVQSRVRAESRACADYEVKKGRVLSLIGPVPWNPGSSDSSKFAIRGRRRLFIVLVMGVVVAISTDLITGIVYCACLVAWNLVVVIYELIYPVWDSSVRLIKYFLYVALGVLVLLGEVSLFMRAFSEKTYPKLVDIFIAGKSWIIDWVAWGWFAFYAAVTSIYMITALRGISCDTRSSKEFISKSLQWIDWKQRESGMRVESLGEK
ncbi:MAG: hypothetical protein KH989_04155 [Kocuria rhizophila]|nr:hypothetical protein [Kocuria rhizophila]